MRYAHLLACRADVEPHAPVEPVGHGLGAVNAPEPAFVECADETENAIRGGVRVREQFGELGFDELLREGFGFSTKIHPVNPILYA